MEQQAWRGNVVHAAYYSNMRSNVVGSAEYRRPRASSVDAAFQRDVRAPAPPQMPIFRSRLQGELLARLLLGPAARRRCSTSRSCSAPISAR